MKNEKVKQSARVEIYSLSDPLTGEVRYIGKANDSGKRLLSHIRDSKRRDYPVYRWIRKLQKNELIPIMSVLCVTDSENWRDKEIELISIYRNNGAKLLNVAKGGDEPFCSIETRRKNGAKSILAMRNASKNDNKLKRLWGLKRELSILLSAMRRRGEIESYNRMLKKIESANRIDLFGNILTKHKIL